MEWKKIFSLPYVCTISTKLRAFQYKYLMRIIPNNYFLFTCKLRPSNLCDFCDSFPDSNKHMFWECGQVQSYWSDISQLLKRNILDYDTDLTYETISFCTTKKKPKQKSVLTSFITCIMLAKYFIFKCKYNETLPTIEQFKLYLRKTIKIEETIAHLRNNIQGFNSKWNGYLHID